MDRIAVMDEGGWISVGEDARELLTCASAMAATDSQLARVKCYHGMLRALDRLIEEWGSRKHTGKYDPVERLSIIVAQYASLIYRSNRHNQPHQRHNIAQHRAE